MGLKGKVKTKHLSQSLAGYSGIGKPSIWKSGLSAVREALGSRAGREAQSPERYTLLSLAGNVMRDVMDKCPQINLHIFSYLSSLDQMFHFAFYKKTLKKKKKVPPLICCD